MIGEYVDKFKHYTSGGKNSKLNKHAYFQIIAKLKLKIALFLRRFEHVLNYVTTKNNSSGHRSSWVTERCHGIIFSC